ncbi:hypothetical protein [Halovenus salina]|uniref:Uncharacterized protein n=1 Tax=Halovenus salina TaxID=1510225 RepID=A0ABD5VZC1_9EURY|nr:hypothetical protein [Halovenus salina]
MNRKTTTYTIALIATLCLLCGLGGVVTGTDATQQQPETPEEFLTTFQDLEGTESFETHNEFEVMRSQAVQDVQVGEFTDAKAQRLDLLLELLRTFDEAYQYQQNESYDRALALGNDSRELTAELREIPQGEQYAVLADIALDRFYEQTGQTLLSRAEGIENTPQRLDVLGQAALSYNKASATERYGQIVLRADRTTQQFETDVETINGTDTAVTGFLDTCTDCDDVASLISGQHVAVFGMYADSLSALSAGEEGVGLAEKHGLTERESQLTGAREQAQEYNQNLAMAGVAIVLGYSAVVGLIAALVTWRLMLWKRDLTDAQYGDVILMGEMLNA